MAKSLLNKNYFGIQNIEIARNDPNELRNRLLNMTSDGRRKLGIRRNTLWYMKKNINDGKRIKVYQKVKQKL